MNKFLILEKQTVCPKVKQIIVKAPRIAKKAQAGQFVSLIVNETGERIPLTMADWDSQQGTLTLIFQEVGKSTALLGSLNPGDSIEHLAGPLGKPSEIENYGTVLIVGGGIGIAPIYPITKALKAAGNKVIVILGARCADLLFWEDKFQPITDELIICTDDGSKGVKGVITVPIKQLLDERKESVQRMVAIGPAIMMKYAALTAAERNIPSVVSLNSIMVDATGMCGACRVEVGGETRFACVDGPEFDGAKVNFEQLIDRQKIYLPEEKLAYEQYQTKVGC